MLKRYIEDIPKLFKYMDMLVITDKEGYIEYYRVFHSLGNRIVENPVGIHILDLHQHLNHENSTIMRVLKNREPIINEKQYLNIFKERTVTALSTTIPLMIGKKVVGAMDINRYFDEDLAQLEEETSQYDMAQKHFFFTIDDIISKNPKMIEVKNQALKAAKTNSSVIIYGETGTGKELVAQAIHNHSFRKNNPFIVQNCATIPSSLGESILFGTTKGSFTGAENKAGIFEMANGGTLVLDELNSMDINLQPKLLRVTENNCFRRVGGKDLINVDVRLISTLNEDPYFMMEPHKIRKDLFYRLGIVMINIPPLRERKEDISLLVNRFIEGYNKKMNKNIKGISKKAMDSFMEYHWPGNVRELKHTIERVFNFIDDEVIDEIHLPSHMISLDKGEKETLEIGEEEQFNFNEVIKEYEIKYIKLALQSSKTLNEAAKLLKLSRQALKYKIDIYGIEVKQK